MSLLLHSAVKINSYFFELPVQRHIEALAGGPEIRERAMRVHPYGQVSCYLGVGGVECEVRRYRGFTGQMPAMPNLMDLEHANLYREVLADTRLAWREDQALAAAVGGILGIITGIGAMGIASFFTDHMAIIAMPISGLLPGALALWAPYLHQMRKKDARLQGLITLIEGLENPHVPAVWRRAVEAAHAFGYSDDLFLREARNQFVEAKGNMLPRYDELGIYLPTYYPPDEHSIRGGYQPISGAEVGAES